MKEIDIMAMTAQDLCLLGELIEIAKKAGYYAEKVRSDLKVTFSIGQQMVEVYREEKCGEYYGYGYVSHSGLFTYRDNWWGGREWEIYLTEEDIYKVLRADFLIQKKRKDLLLPDEYELDQFAPHLLRFLDSIGEE